MTLPFNQMQNTLQPLFFAEVDNSHANYASVQQRALIIGQITSEGAATANIPLLSLGGSHAKEQGGQGSQLALMTEAYRASDRFGEVYYLPVADAGAGVAATAPIVYAGTPTADGAINLYIAGMRVRVAVLKTETATDIAAQLATVINANKDLPVTAAAATGTLTVTAKNKGMCGNDIDLRHNYYGEGNGEVMPAGVTATITAMSGGATNPDIATALANLSDEPFDFIVCPYTDATSLNAIKTFMDDNTGRWAWNRMIYGHVFTAHNGTVGELSTLGSGRNDPHGSILDAGKSPTPSWSWAANAAAVAAGSLRIDPARPLQTLTLKVLPPVLEDRRNFSEKETLLNTGISTYNVAHDGTVSIQRVITTYQKNKFGQEDDSYMSIETMFNLMYIIRFLQTRITSKFARMKLASDETRVLPGSAIVQPKTIRDDQIAAYAELESRGLVQDAGAFAKELIVRRNLDNPNRLDVLWPGTLINQLNQLGVLLQFRR